MNRHRLKQWTMMVMTAVYAVAVSACGADTLPENSGDVASTYVSDVVSTTTATDSAQTTPITSTTTTTTTISTTTTTTAQKVTTTTVASTTTVNRPQATACPHSETKVANAVAATCTREGYTGDTYCSQCNVLTKRGESQPMTKHKNTEIRGKKEPTESSEGYGGDVYCKDCGNKVAAGEKIPKLEKVEDKDENTKVEYILPDGSSLWVEPGTDITAYFMAQKTKKVKHAYAELEKEIVRLCNVEREKAGLKPLTWYEDAYYFTQIRANEAAEDFAHTRPNGTSWHTVYSDVGVHLIGYFGENLYQSEGVALSECAKKAVEGWMGSEGHRENIMSADFNRIAIAIVGDETELTIVQNFFS